ncbi:MAG: magnesium transporter CorA family protein [Lactobacillus sp.]|jgi:magnesium transporter|nr:magnesium transporter CorA family protein [Lactobacillus sp.]MCI2031850.1 magnesium transporter CorA family protein [Lactobacillus sp.]
MLKQTAINDHQTWVAVTAPKNEDFTALATQYQIPKRFVAHVRNGKGRARFDYDYECDCGLFVFKVIAPQTTKQIEQVKTTPLGILLVGETLITVVHGNNDRVMDALKTVIQGPDMRGVHEQTLIMLVMAAMFELNEDYFDRINDLDNLRQKLEKYKTRPSNDQITQLSEVSKSMIYLKAAASGNLIAARQLQAIASSSDYAIALTKDERYWLRNLQEEFDQAREIAQVNGEIVQQVTDAYSNLLDNSLNTTMWILTVWSLALAVPPIISGFYGMNVKLPLVGGWWDWPLTIALSVVPVSVMLGYLRHRHVLSAKNL